MSARIVALDAALEASAKSAPLSDVLAERFAGSGLDRRDRAMAEEIALGALRRRLELDLVISAASRRPGQRMQRPLAETLRQAAYQILILDRVPAHAAVNEAVEILKARLGRKPASFANAVLRKVADLIDQKNAGRPSDPDSPRALHQRGAEFILLKEPVLPRRDQDMAGWLAGAYGFPRWMAARWLDRHGPERTETILRWANSTPALSVRLNPERVGPEWPISEERAAEVFAGTSARVPGEVPGTYRIEAEVAPSDLPGLAAGFFAIQDSAQTRPALLLAPARGATVLDLCSGLGTKSLHLSELVGPEGRVVAVEIEAEKIAKAKDAANRAGRSNIAFVQADALHIDGPAAREYPYVLVDAPCSNLGSLDRRPEVRLRTEERAIAELAEDELELLVASAGRVEPGGALVYSVCSFEKEETEDVVAGFIEGRADFSLASESLVLPEPSVRDGGYAARLLRSAQGAS